MPRQSSNSANVDQPVSSLSMLQGLSFYFTLTILPFLRPDIGYRLLSPLQLLGTTGFLILGSMLSGFPCGSGSLAIFAVLALFLGMRQRWLRWREARAGIVHHTWYIGTSCFEGAKIPAFLKRNRRAARILDPLACALAGWFFIHFQPALGLWLLLSAAGLEILESGVRRRDFDRQLDVGDGMLESERQGKTVDHFEAPQTPQHQQVQVVLSTGAGDDIKDRIKQNRNCRDYEPENR